MDQAFVLPLLAKMYKTSIICYNAYGSIGFEVEGGSRSFRNGLTTNVYLHRPDGKVQCQVLSAERISQTMGRRGLRLLRRDQSP